MNTENTENKIITPGESKHISALKPAETEQLVLAYKRYLELGQSSLIETNAAAEKRGLEAYLHSNLLAHASELLGCWYAVRQEYEPLCVAIGTLLNRAGGIIDARKSKPQ